MDSLKEFLRDLIGILLPGGIFILVIFAFLINLLYMYLPNYFKFIFTTNGNKIILSILFLLSYIAGILLRMKQLKEVDRYCTEFAKKENIREKSKRDVY